jgi:hypothetical protein
VTYTRDTRPMPEEFTTLDLDEALKAVGLKE